MYRPMHGQYTHAGNLPIYFLVLICDAGGHNGWPSEINMDTSRKRVMDEPVLKLRNHDDTESTRNNPIGKTYGELTRKGGISRIIYIHNYT